MIRPIYFIVVCWGAEYRSYLLNYLVASLLAPGNLPALAGSGHKFLFVMPSEDWKIISQAPIVEALARYAEPVHIAIPYPTQDESPCIHMGLGHKLATDMCFNDRAYGFVLTPDALISDGTMRAAQEHALAGKTLVVMAALRFATEPLFEGFAQSGYDRAGDDRSQTAAPLSISGRELVRLGIPAFHSQSLSYDFEAPYFGNSSTCVPAVFWRVPSDGGIVLHSLSWAPVLMDYAAVQTHDTRALEEWTIDGDYLHKNFGESNIHVCTDSDEMMLVSWASLDDKPVSLEPTVGRKLSTTYCQWRNSAAMRLNLSLEIFDPMKIKLFPRPVRWHIADIDKNWLAVERKAARIIAARPPHWIDMGKMAVRVSQFSYLNRQRMQIVWRAAQGDRGAWKTIRRRLGRLVGNSHLSARGSIASD